MSDQEKLAKLMGWPKSVNIRTLEVRFRRPGGRNLPFDPENDVSDCESVIEFLNSKGWQVEVHWQFTDDESLAPGAYVHIWNRFSEVHERTDVDVDRWKQAVCELALKVLT